MINVENFNLLKAIQNKDDKELALVEEEQKIYQYNEPLDIWEEYNSPEGSLNLSLYELNQQLMAQMPDLTEEDIAQAKNQIEENMSSNGEYFMLLCNDLHYYTIFKTNDKDAEETFSNEVFECLTGLSENIKSFAYDEENKAFEIWFSVDENSYVAYLFNYDGGVIKCL